MLLRMMRTPTFKKSCLSNQNQLNEGKEFWSPPLVGAATQEIVWDKESPTVVQRITRQAASCKDFKKQCDVSGVVQQLSVQMGHFQDQGAQGTDDDFWQSFLPLDADIPPDSITNKKLEKNKGPLSCVASLEIPEELHLLAVRLRAEDTGSASQNNIISSTTNTSILEELNDELSDSFLLSTKEMEDALFDPSTQSYHVPPVHSSPVQPGRATFRLDGSPCRTLRPESPLKELVQCCQEISEQCTSLEQVFHSEQSDAEVSFGKDGLDLLLGAMMEDAQNSVGEHKTEDLFPISGGQYVATQSVTCSPEEIEEKRKIALLRKERRTMKRTSISDTSPNSQPHTKISPNCQPTSPTLIPGTQQALRRQMKLQTIGSGMRYK